MKILYITTIGGTMSFFNKLIKDLIDCGNVVDIATNEKESSVPVCYREWGCKIYPISCSRSPFKSGNLKAIKEIKKIVENDEYEIVHCHTPIAAACTRLACKGLRKKGVKVIYTAHGFHFYKGAPKKNWLIYYPVEKICARWTDVLITINKEDYALACKKMKARRVEYVPGVGIDFAKFKNTVVDKQEKRRKIGVPDDAFVLLSVGELNANKNHEVVIRALAQIKDEKIHYAIAGQGKLKKYLCKLATDLGIADRVHLLGYRTDIAELYKAADVCVFPSIREGLGLAAVEGMAAGLALIVSDNRGTRDYSVNNENALVCKAISADDFANAIQILSDDIALRCDMGEKNKLISRKYNIENILKSMERIYFENN
jgi:glycosyltransferase involved in cell wall biosynthesis